MWCIPAVEHYLTIKRHEILTHATTWWPRKHYSKWKKPVTKDQIVCDSMYLKWPEHGSLQRQKLDGLVVVAQDWRVWRVWMGRAEGYGGCFWCNKNVSKLTMAMVAQLYEYTKSHWIEHSKWVNCIMYEFSLSTVVTKESVFYWNCQQIITALNYLV